MGCGQVSTLRSSREQPSKFIVLTAFLVVFLSSFPCFIMSFLDTYFFKGSCSSWACKAGLQNLQVMDPGRPLAPGAGAWTLGPDELIFWVTPYGLVYLNGLSCLSSMLGYLVGVDPEIQIPKRPVLLEAKRFLELLGSGLSNARASFAPFGLRFHQLIFPLATFVD